MATKILTYHSIGPQNSNEPGADLYCVNEDIFKQHMRFLKTQYRIDNTNPMVTFDDGFNNNYTQAYPALVEFGLTAYFFVIAPKVGEPGYMTWQQINELKNAGMIIGSHGMTHKILTMLNDKDMDYEIKESKKILEDNLKSRIDTISIPRGFYNQAILDKIKKAGYAKVFTSDPRDTDGFKFGRISVKASWDMKRFARMLEEKYSFKEQAEEFMKTVSKKILGAGMYDKMRTTILKGI